MLKLTCYQCGTPVLVYGTTAFHVCPDNFDAHSDQALAVANT